MNTDEQLDDCLSVRDGHLFMDACDTTDLIAEYGSPLFVLSEDQLRRNVRQFQEAFQDGWTAGPVKVMPAAKANWLLAAQRVLADEGCGCDIYSPGELDVALRAGFDPEHISVNGVPKSEEHIRRTIEVGARLTIDAVEEVDTIARVAQDLGRTASVRLRLRPVLDGFIEPSDFVAEGRVPTDLVAYAYKGGLSFEEVMSIAPRLMEMEGVEVVGFHEHHGRHSRTVAYWKAQMRAYARDIGRVCEALGGFKPWEIDIGGGFAVPRDPFNAATDYNAPRDLGRLNLLSKLLQAVAPRFRYSVLQRLIATVSATPNAIAAPSIADYAAAVTGTLLEELPRNGVDPSNVTLQLEPGRSMHGNAGIHLATVQAIKHATKPLSWKHVITDTTEFWLTGGRYEHHLHEYRVANKASAPRAEMVDVCGRSCYGDRIMPAVFLPEVEVGDVFAMLDTGAYQEVSCSNFNAMPRPATVMVQGDAAHVVRRAETLVDVFDRDVLPAHLSNE
jgi:diaminopimelate decarboxylase